MTSDTVLGRMCAFEATLTSVITAAFSAGKLLGVADEEMLAVLVASALLRTRHRDEGSCRQVQQLARMYQHTMTATHETV